MFSVSINRIIQVLLLFLFVLNVSEALFSPLFAVFITSSILGATLKTVGFAVAIYAITKSIVQVPLAKSIDRKMGERDDFYLMFLGGIVVSLQAFFLIGVTKPWQLYLLQVFGGIGGASIMAAYYALFSRHTDRGKEAFEWSLFSVGGLTISAAVGAFLGGIIADALGFKMLFLTSGILSLLATVLLLLGYPYLQKSKVQSSHSAKG